MRVDSEGWLAGARRVESPNCDARPAATVIDTLVIHHISLPPEYFIGDAIERLFTNRLDPQAHPYFERLREVHVSAHFLVRRRGELLQFVSCEQRAWHAGASRLLERERCNDFSIGIELEGSSARPFTKTQYRRLEQLVVALRRRYPLRFIAGHSDIAPGRKDDPGPHFDWRRLRPALRLSGIERPF
jgi:N-acetyl-anhydromuramoyl-L-alanine amidase